MAPLTFPTRHHSRRWSSGPPWMGSPHELCRPGRFLHYSPRQRFGGASNLAGRVGCCKQREAEARAAEGGLVVRPDLSTMRFDDGSGNGKSHAHAAVVGREKTLKELREMI